MAVDAPKFRLPSLKALQAYEAAARHESFARAAAELCVTPGAVAQQVKSLEEWLGFPLFERHSQGLRLTDDARGVLPSLVRAFDRLGDAVLQLRDMSPNRQVHIAALPCIAQLWLSPRLPLLRKTFPDLQISITAMETPPNFQREPYDLALFYRDKAETGPEIIALSEDKLFPVCSPVLLEQQTDIESLLQCQPLLADTVWADDWPAWLAHAGLARIQPANGPSFSLYSLALQAAVDGGGILIGRNTLVSKAMQRGDLVAPSDIQLPSQAQLSLMMPAVPGKGHRLHNLVDWLRKSAKN